MKKKVQYRKHNFYAHDNRVDLSIKVHPDLKHGLMDLAKFERKSVSWIVETALAQYFGVDIILKEIKHPRPSPED